MSIADYLNAGGAKNVGGAKKDGGEKNDGGIEPPQLGPVQSLIITGGQPSGHVHPS